MGLYENIKTVAGEKGISVYKIEKDLGFARSSIKKFDTSIPSVEKIRLIADYLDVSVDRILHPERRYYLNEETAKVAQEVFDDPDTRMLFDAARSASPEAIKLAAEMLKTFKKTNPDG